MAIQKSSFHIRSISFPSVSHPENVSIENHFRKLTAAQAGTSSSSSICQNLCSIKDLYEQINNLIHLSHNLKGLCREEFEEILEGSLVLFDASSSAIDALSQMNQSISSLESALRRGSKDEGNNTYLISRKKIIKTVSKCLVNLKKAEKKCDMSFAESDSNIVKMLKEAQALSLLTLKSVLSYVKGHSGGSQTHGWSVIAKLVNSKNASYDAENATEIDQVDQSLSTETKAVLLKQVQTLEVIINELEDTMESVSRCLVKTRVSLLNVINQF